MAQQEYVHGSMDVTVQEKTFATFLKFASRTVITVAVVLILLALANA